MISKNLKIMSALAVVTAACLVEEAVVLASTDDSLQPLMQLPRQDVHLGNVVNSLLGKEYAIRDVPWFPIPIQQNSCGTLYKIIDRALGQIEDCKNGKVIPEFMESDCTGKSAIEAHLYRLNFVYDMNVYHSERPKGWQWSIIPASVSEATPAGKLALIKELARTAQVPVNQVYVLDAPNPYTSKEVIDVKARFKSTDALANKRYDMIEEYFQVHPNPSYDNDLRKVELAFSAANPSKPTLVTNNGLQFCDLLAGHGFIDVEYTWKTFKPHAPLPQKIAADIFAFKQMLQQELDGLASLSLSDSEQAAVAGFLAGGATVQEPEFFKDVAYDFTTEDNYATLFTRLFAGGSAPLSWQFDRDFTEELAAYVVTPQTIELPAEKLAWRYRYSAPAQP